MTVGKNELQPQKEVLKLPTYNNSSSCMNWKKVILNNTFHNQSRYEEELDMIPWIKVGKKQKKENPEFFFLIYSNYSKRS